MSPRRVKTLEPEPDLQLSSTAYALLGLLSLRPWTTYELAQQMRRSVSWVFPRAERSVYTETKRLAARGLADAAEGFTGKRRSTTYTITAAGEAALAAWMTTPAAPTTIESEPLARVLFADRGSREDLLAVLNGVREQAEAALDELTTMAGQTARGEAPFVERVAWQALGMRFAVDFHQLLADWAEWAGAEVEQWPSIEGAPTEPGMAVFTELASRTRRA